MASFDSPEMLRALESIEQGNYSYAFELLVPLAQTGNPKAQCNLANLYHFGWGVEVDAKKAIELYHRSPSRISENNICLDWLTKVFRQFTSRDSQEFSRTVSVLQNLRPAQKS